MLPENCLSSSMNLVKLQDTKSIHSSNLLCCSWGSQGKNTEGVCHSLLQWTTFCQTSPPWPVHLGWPHMAWLSFIGLDKAVVPVWLDWLVFCDYGFSVSALWCPPATRTVLTWVSITLDVGYLFTAAPAKRSCCSLPWTRGISSLAAPSDLEHGIAPLGPLVPAQPPLLGGGVAPLECKWEPRRVLND